MPDRRFLYRFLFTCAQRWSAQLERRDRRPPQPGDFLILSAHTAHIAAYAQIAAANKRIYAQRHGYTFRDHTDGFVANRAPSWSKIPFLKQALRSYRWVFWSDADALVMNQDFRLESLVSPGHDITLTHTLTPFPHINAGHLFLRSSPFTQLFLTAVWRMEAFIHDATWEQRAINHLCSSYAFARVKIVPNRLFNAFAEVPDDPAPYQPGDFIVHFPGVPDKPSKMLRYTALLS